MRAVLSVAIGAFFGAITRFWLSEHLTKGTWLVNSSGSFLLGVVITTSSNLLAIGFCGSFTTFSTFSVEVITLWQQNKKQALCYVAFTTILSIIACLVGLLIKP